MMCTISKAEYLKNPCRISSDPYWKAKSINVPDTIKIVHEDYYIKKGQL